jgi:hypothetical protein
VNVFGFGLALAGRVGGWRELVGFEVRPSLVCLNLHVELHENIRL